MKTCGYGGCRNEAHYTIRQNVGKCQELNVCPKCAPKWLREGRPTRFYDVTWRKDMAAEDLLAKYYGDDLSPMSFEEADIISKAFRSPDHVIDDQAQAVVKHAHTIMMGGSHG